MKIIIDIDDTIADLMPEWLRRWNVSYNTDLKVEDVTQWHFAEKLGIDLDEFFAILKEPDLYDHVSVIPGALEGVRKLKAAGHEVQFASAGFNPSKGAWLKRNFFAPDGFYLVVPDKTRLTADVLIDDKLETAIAWGKWDRLAVVPAREWNARDSDGRHWADVDCVYRAYSWQEIVRVILGYARQEDKSLDEVEINENGGMQSKIGARYDLIDSLAIESLARVLQEGAQKYEENNWRKIPARDHVNHAINHLYKYLAGDDTSEDHLAHAQCRTHMAVAMERLAPSPALSRSPERSEGAVEVEAEGLIQDPGRNKRK